MVMFYLGACVNAQDTMLLYGVIVIVEVDVSGPQAVSAHKVLVARRSLVLGVSCQHALDAHAHALHILNWAPSLRS